MTTATEADRPTYEELLTRLTAFEGVLLFFLANGLTAEVLERAEGECRASAINLAQPREGAASLPQLDAMWARTAKVLDATADIYAKAISYRQMAVTAAQSGQPKH